MRLRTEDESVVDEALIDELAQQWDGGEVLGVGDPVKRGRPRMSDEPLVMLSFRVPESKAKDISQAAQACGLSRSAFLRKVVTEQADLLLSTQQ